MRKLSLFIISLLIVNNIYSQANNTYQKGLSADKNLQAIGNLSPYSTGGVGFDDRYEGVKGSVRLFDKLLPSYLRVKGEDYYIQIDADLDLLRNTLIFTHPKTGKLLSIPSDIVTEVVITSDGKDIIFRTTEGRNFEKKPDGMKFVRILKDGKYQFIKITWKKFIEADYKGAYTSDRRYDEYETVNKYYILCSDSIFHQLQLNRKSLVKLFPDKKELINSTFKQEDSSDNEEVVIAILDKF
jgi:hypothetical protein